MWKKHVDVVLQWVCCLTCHRGRDDEDAGHDEEGELIKRKRMRMIIIIMGL